MALGFGVLEHISPFSLVSSGNSGSSSRSPFAPFGKLFSQFFTIKLDESNFLLWKSIVVQEIQGFDLDGYLFGTLPPTDTVLADGSSNLEYKIWFNREKVLLG
ncbi:hypothetical protein Scep_021736 [Stephania cephalantha]|uniref:Retrotransposon Copia-like N-terminal domain-containing protein n=1 Tax=Stephania cephalantha TaxID=152367 RepID=A0AAP0I0G5_9MAGN